MSDGAGSGATGRSFNERSLRGFIRSATMLGYIAIIGAVMWVGWTADNRALTHDPLPGWYTAPGEVVPEVVAQEAARGICYLAALVNGELQEGACRTEVHGAAWLACFEASRNTWCSDRIVVAATAFWLLLALSLVTAWNLSAPRRSPSLQPLNLFDVVILPGLGGLLLLAQVHFQLRFDAVIVAGCDVESGGCVVDVSSKAPTALAFSFFGAFTVIQALMFGYSRRRKFVDQAERKVEEAE